jgi:hypothetical protein
MPAPSMFDCQVELIKINDIKYLHVLTNNVIFNYQDIKDLVYEGKWNNVTKTIDNDYTISIGNYDCKIWIDIIENKIICNSYYTK